MVASEALMIAGAPNAPADSPANQPILPLINPRREMVCLLFIMIIFLSHNFDWYDHNKSGIGFHGDAERKIVICLSLGQKSILRFQWRMPGSSEHNHPPTDLIVNHGDIYIMSEKATGFDWKKRSKVRVVHAAGHTSYINK